MTILDSEFSIGFANSFPYVVTIIHNFAIVNLFVNFNPSLTVENFFPKVDKHVQKSMAYM